MQFSAEHAVCMTYCMLSSFSINESKFLLFVQNMVEMQFYSGASYGSVQVGLKPNGVSPISIMVINMIFFCKQHCHVSCNVCLCRGIGQIRNVHHCSLISLENTERRKIHLAFPIWQESSDGNFAETWQPPWVSASCSLKLNIKVKTLLFHTVGSQSLKLTKKPNVRICMRIHLGHIICSIRKSP